MVILSPFEWNKCTFAYVLFWESTMRHETKKGDKYLIRVRSLSLSSPFREKGEKRERASYVGKVCARSVYARSVYARSVCARSV